MGGINYPLLSDFYPHGATAIKYGVLRSDGTAERAIFVIDKEGIVRFRDIHDINTQPDNEEVLNVLRELEPDAAQRWKAQATTRTATTPPQAASEALSPQQAETTAGAPATQVLMYCTPWCPDCELARDYFKAKGIAYTEINITKDKEAEKRARELAQGKLVTPTFDINGTIILDFDRAALDRALGQ